MSRRVLPALLGLLLLTATALAGEDSPRLPGYPDHTRLLIVRDAEGNDSPVQSPTDWRVRRDHILGHVQQVMGPLPGGERRVKLDVQVVEEVEEASYTRRKITYASEPGDRLTAWLLIPHEPTDSPEIEQALRSEIEELRAQLNRTLRVARKGSDPAITPIRTRLAKAEFELGVLKNESKRRPERPPCPAVLALHQTIAIGKDEPVGLGGRPTLRYGQELAERGYVVLAPDYPNFGEHKVDVYALGYDSASMKAVWDNMRGVDLLRSMPEVDPERIGVIGHSLGGHNAIFTAVFDERIKAVVSSCGFNAFPFYQEGDLTGWSHKGYMPRIAEVYDRDPAKMPFDFPELIAAIAPRGFFTNSPRSDSNFDVAGVHVCIDAAGDVYRLLDASKRLRAIFPDAEHDFPDEQRKQAYEFLDSVLRPPSGTQ